MVKGVKGFQEGHKHSEEVKKKIGDANRKQVYFNCDYCGQVSSDAPSKYNKKKRHFCSMGCYSEFRKNKLPMEEQNAYKGVRNPGESKQVYHRRYVKKHPERIARLKARRYASERNAEGSHSLIEWQELKQKYDNKCAHCKEKKKLTKDHIVPLSIQAYDILKQLEGLRTTSRYVFPSVKTSSECMSTETLTQVLKRLGFKGKHTAHGFRATARTLLDEEIEYRTDIVEHQLAHKVKDPNGTAYNRTKFLRRRREMMQLWSDYLDTLRQGGDVSKFKPNDESENLILFKQNSKTA